ncbi:FecR domain-containing protein [Cytophagaceae bacterium DM2B3-1]|uniref:FecR domain-containing protein n=1 Tax=Xanthocytophaga flava TaxID=3048013 RepID=A0ABT7CG05_9BACT|nr:FecR domain-containing protein [Xanthocytophaga flavus]MDJ1492608.1 FecR domain-containing protein [Xanthocytophaga flavus]
MKKPVTQEILFEYFAGRATLLQKNMIEKWLQDPENEEAFYECLDKWEMTYPQYIPDLEQAHTKYRSFVLENQATHSLSKSVFGQDTTKTKNFFWGWISVAASILLIVSVMFWTMKDVFFYQTYQTAYGETRTLILPDHSQIVLNAHSTLRIPRDFLNNTQREVWLEGEAFFSIRKNFKAKKFIVHTGNLNVEVLGTKFNVSDRRGSTRVVLKEGKVKVSASAGKQVSSVYMRPGDLVAFSPKDTVLKRMNVKPELYTAWQENKLVFDSIPLSEVLQTVEDYYGIKIILQDTSFNQQYYTGTLPNNDLEVILNSLSSIYGLHVTRTENQIILQ